MDPSPYLAIAVAVATALGVVFKNSKMEKRLDDLEKAHAHCQEGRMADREELAAVKAEMRARSQVETAIKANHDSDRKFMVAQFDEMRLHFDEGKRRWQKSHKPDESKEKEP